MFSRVWRWIKRTLFGLVLVLILLVTFVVYLGVTSPEPRTSDWQKFNDLPRPRGEAAGAIGARLTTDQTAPGEPGGSALDQFFVIGGLSGFGSTVDAVDIFDPGTATWSQGPPLPEPRHHVGATGVGGIVLVSGGARTTTDWTPTDTMWQLLPTEETWNEIEPMPDARMGHAMVTIESKVYVVGGRGETSNVMVFDAREGTWSTGAEMPEPRDHLGVAVSGLRIYAIGGRHTELTDRVDVYDTVLDRWLEGPPLPEPMSGMTVGTLTDGIHVVGGEDPATIGGGVIDKHYVLVPGETEWTEAPLPILATHGSAHGVLRGSLVKIGGARRQGALSPVAWTGLAELYTLGVAGEPRPTPTAS